MALSAARTLRILTKYGYDVSFRTYASSSYEVLNGKTTKGAATDHTVKILEPYGKASSPVESFDSQTGVRQACAFTIASPSGLTFTPKIGVEIIETDRTWRITAMTEIAYRGSVILYEFAIASKPALDAGVFGADGYGGQEYDS